MTAFIASMFAWTSEKMPIRTAGPMIPELGGLWAPPFAAFNPVPWSRGPRSGATEYRVGRSSRFRGDRRVRRAARVAVLARAVERLEELSRERVVHAEIALGLRACRIRLRTAARGGLEREQLECLGGDRCDDAVGRRHRGDRRDRAVGGDVC